MTRRLNVIDFPFKAVCLLDTIRANIDNPKLSNKDFRQFVKDSMLPKEDFDNWKKESND
jgi:hypothetical protein